MVKIVSNCLVKCADVSSNTIENNFISFDDFFVVKYTTIVDDDQSYSTEGIIYVNRRYNATERESYFKSILGKRAKFFGALRNEIPEICSLIYDMFNVFSDKTQTFGEKSLKIVEVDNLPVQSEECFNFDVEL